MEFINRTDAEIESKEDKKNEILQRNKEASIYDSILTPKYFHRVEIDSCLDKLNPQKRELILDAGCGTGRFSQELTTKGCRVIAIDYSIESLKICKERCKNLDPEPIIIKADISDLPLKPEIIDKIISIGVFQHIPTQRCRINSLREMKRVLKPDGRLVITGYNYDLPSRVVRDKSGYHAGKIYYYKYSYSELKKTLFTVFNKVEICGILNFVKYCWSIQNRFNRLNTILEGIGFFLVIEKLDRTLEKTPLSHIMGHSLCACIKK